MKTMTACRDYSIVSDLVEVRCLPGTRRRAWQRAAARGCLPCLGSCAAPGGAGRSAAPARCAHGNLLMDLRQARPAAQDKKARSAPGAPTPSKTMDTSQLQ